MKIMINFDIRDGRPYKSVRLYDIKGNALGFGDKILSKTNNESTLFSAESDYITYLVEMEDDVLKSLLGISIVKKSTVVEKKIDPPNVNDIAIKPKEIEEVKEIVKEEVKFEIPILDTLPKEALWGEDNQDWVAKKVKESTGKIQERIKQKEDKLDWEGLL